MISTRMREYSFFQYGEPDEYGQPVLSEEPVGTIKVSITTTNQAIQDNIQYKGATYLGLTQDSKVDDTYVIQYGESRLKVLYVTPGRYKQVFMAEI